LTIGLSVVQTKLAVNTESVVEGQNRLQIADVYEFESGYFGTSPQFVCAYCR
jgi:hypothetical protein